MSGSLSRRLRAVPSKWLAGTVAAIGLGVSSLFGGLAPAGTDGPPAVATGAMIKGTPWDVTIVDGRVLSSQSGLTTDHDGDRWFVVIATVDVTSPDSRDDLVDVLRVHGVPGLRSVRPDRFLLARDGTDVGYLNPGMPERVAFCWEQRGTEPLPTSVDVDVYNETLRPDSLSGDVHGGIKIWTDPRIVATVHAPVTDKRT